MNNYDYEDQNIFLSAHDLPPYDEIPVTIKKYCIESIGNSNKLCLLEFHEFERKVLILNKTNAERIAYLYGKDFNDWIGKRITLYTTKVEYDDGIPRLTIIIRRTPSQKSPDQKLKY